MSLRVFVVVAVLMIAVVLNAALIFFEHTPELQEASAEYKVEDLHKDMVWIPANRRKNLTAFGLPEPLVDQILERIGKIQQRDRKGDFLRTIKGSPDVAGTLCTNVGTLPSRYQATGMLINGERGTRRRVVGFDRVRTKLSFQEGFRSNDLEGLYKSTELQPNAPPDAYALNVAALLLGEEVERSLGEDQWRQPTFGSLSIQGFMGSHQEIELDMIEFFATLHYIHEVARDPKNQFCGVLAGVTFEED